MNGHFGGCTLSPKRFCSRPIPQRRRFLMQLSTRCVLLSSWPTLLRVQFAYQGSRYYIEALDVAAGNTDDRVAISLKCGGNRRANHPRHTGNKHAHSPSPSKIALSVDTNFDAAFFFPHLPTRQPPAIDRSSFDGRILPRSLSAPRLSSAQGLSAGLEPILSS